MSEQGVKQKDRSKFEPYSSFVLSGHGTYLTPLEMSAELILKALAVKELRTQQCVATCTKKSCGVQHEKLFHVPQL